MLSRIAASRSHVLVCVLMSTAPVLAQAPKNIQNANTNANTALPPPAVPKDYVVGVEDVLHVVFWQDKELSAEVVVRPDGKISLPMLNDLPAVGMTPEQLAATVQEAAKKFSRNPGATVIVKEIRSRKVYIVGEVAKPGTLSLGSDMNVLQAIAQAGGFLEDAKKDAVVIVRVENGQERRYKFNYNDVIRGKHVEQNIRLFPGDTILIR